MARRGILVEGGGGLPVAPLVDVVLLLLIFFILVSRMPAPSFDVTLPEAQAAQVTDSLSVLVVINADGQRVLVDGQALSFAELPAALQEYSSEPDTVVRIMADSSTDYSYVIQAMDAAAAAGLNKIALETRYPE